ncbi:MAG: hypothetical protein QOH05_1325 [Acetobacteraceae bacterium]|nr:hypothetical protein [Acetobacteraceae bacterium]
MPPAPLCLDEADRLAALRTYEVLDTVCEESFDTIVRLASRLTGCPIALVSLVDADRQWFKARYGLDFAGTPRDQAFCAHAVIDPSRPLVVPDATKDARFASSPLVTGDAKFRFYAGMPLVNPEGYALGTLCIIDRQPKEIGADVLDTLVGLAQTVMTTLELRRALLQMQHMALTDRLTGLPNRPAFLAALVKAIARQRRDGQPFSLLFVDLDHFKQVNVCHGHAAGDRALVTVADALVSCMRSTDTVGRMSGDEFVALLQGGDGQEAVCAGERIRGAIAARMAAGGWNVTASVGAVAFFDPPASESDALAAADALMYEAKLAGKNQVLCRDFVPLQRLAAVGEEVPAQVDG